MDWAHVALEIAREAGQFLLEVDLDQLDRDHKRGVELVTAADRDAEELITDLLRERAPGHEVLGEESFSGISLYSNVVDWERWRRKEWLWVVDPVDGTVNFAQGLPIWCVSIALCHRGEPVAGAVVAPAMGFELDAARGSGTFLRWRGERERVGVSRTTELSRAVCATGFPYDKASSEENNIAQFGAIVPHLGGIRRFGSAAIDLSLVASGRLDGYWELKLNPWDCAAGGLAVEEAGGIITTLGANPWTPFHLGLICGNRSIQPALVDLLRKTMETT